ncbi:DUF3800 domain-containing protein [Desulfofundulus salinus]|uniref:DUF3800 domain-containing protein n=2 Tax=Desulfofundulus salinus TaxID=2419843 RepID=A0A494WYW3_9FIRM|nr:DUF3800 domain-containing protein [Desulfofundulus salinum]
MLNFKNGRWIMAEKVFNVYIDEAGDEGFKVVANKWLSSRWFVIGALVVPAEFDREMASVINKIKDRIKYRNKLKPLHFCKLNHKKKKVAIQEIKEKGHFRLIITGVYKPDLIKDGVLKNEKQFLYNYITRYLLERVTWLADEYKRKVRLTFENRSNTSFDQLDNYIQQVLKDPKCQIRKDMILSWRVLNKSQSKNLQVADSLVSSVYAALEPDDYGNIETSYIMELKEFLYIRKGNLFSYGLKLFPYSGDSRILQERILG